QGQGSLRAVLLGVQAGRWPLAAAPHRRPARQRTLWHSDREELSASCQVGASKSETRMGNDGVTSEGNMSKTAIKIGPQDHGRRMSLDDFDLAEVQEGYLYELSRGVITVSDVPGRRHLVQLRETRRQFDAFDISHPGVIDTIAGGGECKLLIPPFDSERHPDL